MKPPLEALVLGQARVACEAQREALTEERFERLVLVLASARRLIEILAILNGKIQQRFPRVQPPPSP